MGKNRNEGKNGGKRSDEAKLPWDEGVAYKKMVEHNGGEPLTSTMPLWRL